MLLLHCVADVLMIAVVVVIIVVAVLTYHDHEISSRKFLYLKNFSELRSCHFPATFRRSLFAVRHSLMKLTPAADTSDVLS